jgi:hypothetical protein
MNYPKVKLITSRIEEEKKEKVFEIDESKLVTFTEDPVIRLPSGRIERRTDSELQNKALYLPPCYDYQIVRDNVNSLCLLVIIR